MIQKKFIGVIAIMAACFAVSSATAATIPAGTTLTVTTVSLVSSESVVGRSFEAKLAQDVSVKGNGVIKAGTKVFGKITSSRANRARSKPLTVELASIEVKGQRVAIKTNRFEPGSSPATTRQARYGHTGGTLVVNPGTRMQFQLTEAATW